MLQYSLSVRRHSDIFEQCQKCKVPVSRESFLIEGTLQSKLGRNILESLHQKTKIPSIGIPQQSTPRMSFD